MLVSGSLQVKWGINEASELYWKNINGSQRKKEEEDKRKKEKYLKMEK